MLLIIYALTFQYAETHIPHAKHEPARMPNPNPNPKPKPKPKTKSKPKP